MANGRLVGICGSLRKASHNRKLMLEAARTFDAAAFIDGNIRFPLYDEDLEAADGIPPGVALLADQVASADAAVVVTPEYNKAMSGALKTALVWMSRVEGDPWRDKPVAILSAAAGRAGERFAVRNSGAQAVVEGCGSNGCEYMTGGVAVILGAIGANFGAGMTGGMAYLHDPEGQARINMNLETLVVCPVTGAHWLDQLEGLIEAHARETGSRKARDILRHWDTEKSRFLQVCPKEMLDKLDFPLGGESVAIPAE